MITLTREEAQSVLDTVDDIPHFHNAAIETLRARLSAPEPEEIEKVMLDVWRDVSDPRFPHIKAQPEPEPVADKYLMEVECTKCGAKQDGVLTVTAPPQREWQGLVHDDIFEAELKCEYYFDHKGNAHLKYPEQFARIIEAKLKEKNT